MGGRRLGEDLREAKGLERLVLEGFGLGLKLKVFGLVVQFLKCDVPCFHEVSDLIEDEM